MIGSTEGKKLIPDSWKQKYSLLKIHFKTGVLIIKLEIISKTMIQDYYYQSLKS